MFDSPYPIRYSNKVSLPGAPYILHILTFRCRMNRQYIIHVEQYAHHVFAVKFFLKSHRDSERKYNLLSGLNDPFRVLSTIMNTMKYFEERFPLASFAFFGSELEGEAIENTKRFRVYVPISENFFATDKYEHLFLVEESFYLILNIEHKKQNKNLYPYIVDTFKIMIGKQEG